MSTAVHVIESDSVAPQPWRNGGGETRELLTWPGPQDWQLRISLAEIRSDGPFSAFPDVWRWFTVIEGAGVVLRFGDFQQPSTVAGGPISFDGGSPPDCRLIQGPTRDLNLMARGGHSVMRTVEPGVSWSGGFAQCGLFTAVPGTLVPEEGPATSLPALTLAWYAVAPDSPLRFEASVVREESHPAGWWLGFEP